jgi:DNA-binding PadR family transcriptional regulator
MKRTPAGGSASAPPLTPVEFHILLSLSDEARHGYAILQDVVHRTDGQIQLRTGTLYTVIKRMLDGAWLEERDGANDADPRRRYYGLTPRGRDVLRAEAKRMQTLVALAQDKRLLGPTRKLSTVRER